MPSLSKTGWKKAFGVDGGESYDFFGNLREVEAAGSAAPQPHTLRRAFEQFGLDGILCQDKTPIIYFKCVDQIVPDEISVLQRQVWNQGVAPVLVVVAANEVQIFSALVRPTPSQAEGLIERLEPIPSVLQRFTVSVESGEYFHTHHKSFDPKQRVDRSLLRNLEAARKRLDDLPNNKLPSPILDALLCRLVFSSYLFDRGVIDRAYLAEAGIPNAGHLRDVLGRKPRPASSASAELYQLFAHLGRDFNGDLFSDDLGAESQQIRAEHLDILDDFFRGTDAESGQQAFWPYDFGVIPIETVSAIYEHFLKTEGEEKKKEAGAFYTPRLLAELLLDVTLEGMSPLLGKRFLDPACGSGIFLVGLFNRLAEEWKRENPSAPYDLQASELMRVLTENLYGIDRHPTACHITAFSLYLAYLDQLSPPDIRRLRSEGRVLPYLLWPPQRPETEPSPPEASHFHESAVARSTVEVDPTAISPSASRRKMILCADFFSDGVGPIQKVHAVLGNPPWGSTATPSTPAGAWCSSYEHPLPDNQMAAAFMWKATEHLEPDGKVCFVLPHGILFNHSPTALAFQSKWLRQKQVDLVVNLVDFQRFLFEDAEAPAVVIGFRGNPPKNAAHGIEYWAPKTDWRVTQTEVICVLPQDRSRIPLREVLEDLKGDDAPLIWKRRLWATPRDWRLLDRLTLFPRLRDVAGSTRDHKRWLIAEGFQPFGKNDVLDERDVLSLPSNLFIQATDPRMSLFLLPGDCTELGSPEVAVRGKSNKNTHVFRSPHVLVTQGFSRVAFADFAVSFQHAVRGIHGPAEDRDILVFLAAYLRSPLARYFLFHTSSNWGVSRAKVHVGELLRLPFYLPNDGDDPKRCVEIVREVAQIVDAARREAEKHLRSYSAIVPNITFSKLTGAAKREAAVYLKERRSIADRVTSETTKLIGEYFDVDDIENILVTDTDTITIPSVRPTQSGVGQAPTAQPADERVRSSYSKLLCDTLNTWANSTYQIQSTVSADAKLGIGVIVLEKTLRGELASPAKVASGDVMSILHDIQASASTRHSTIELVRGVKVFDKSLLYIVKPISQRFWTRTSALNDADEIAAAILMRPTRRST